MREGADKRGYAPSVAIPAFRFLDEASAAADTVQGTDAANIDIRFMLDNYTVSYQYDAAAKTYARSINGEPHTDLVSGEQLQAANVAVIGTAHKTLDGEGRLAVDLESGGPAMLFRYGKVIECTWERGGDGVIRLMKDGGELPFAPGKIYYHIVPNATALTEHVTAQ